jgi:uncharacterized membrane protein
MKPVLLILMIGFYLFAGVNHFWNPRFYTPLIPPYLANFTNQINILSGIAEIVLAIGLIFPATRTLSAYGIIALLIAFIPAHIYMIQLGKFSLGKFEMTPLIGWARLLIVHPLLIGWAWWMGK